MSHLSSDLKLLLLFVPDMCDVKIEDCFVAEMVSFFVVVFIFYSFCYYLSVCLLLLFFAPGMFGAQIGDCFVAEIVSYVFCYHLSVCLSVILSLSLFSLSFSLSVYIHKNNRNRNSLIWNCSTASPCVYPAPNTCFPLIDLVISCPTFLQQGWCCFRSKRQRMAMSTTCRSTTCPMPYSPPSCRRPWSPLPTEGRQESSMFPQLSTMWLPLMQKSSQRSLWLV